MPENSSDINAVDVNQTSNQEQTISSEVTHAVEQLPKSPQAGLSGIEELLAQLQTAIEASNDLQSEKKAEALEQVKVLAAAGKNPLVEENSLAAKAAMGVLQEIIKKIPGAPTLVGTWKRILPELSEIFGQE